MNQVTAIRRVLLGHHGQRGDLLINLPTIKLMAKLNPEISFYIPINKKYKDMIELFLHIPYVNGVFITDEYEKFPNKLDEENLRKLHFVSVYSPMEPHRDEWYLNRHQTQAVYFDYFGYEPPPEFDCQIELLKYFSIPNYPNAIAFAPFAGFYNQNNDKKLTTERAQEIVNLLKKSGYGVLQVGGNNEPKLDGTVFYDVSFFESIKNILGCKLFITTDTGANWAISGYKFPTIGLYSHRYYGPKYIKNIQPINPNAIYLDAQNVNDIALDKIEESVKNIIK